MERYFLTIAVQKFYDIAKEYGDVLVDNECMYDDKFGQVNNEILASFHPAESSFVYHHEEYFCGIRASGHIVSCGYTQLDDRLCVVVQGNHKGDMSVTAFFMSGTNANKIMFGE